jgi:ferredoxin
MAEKYTVTIDRSVCMGSGVCVTYAGQTFDQDEEARARVINPEGNSLDDIRVAVEGCPTGAISLELR